MSSATVNPLSCDSVLAQMAAGANNTTSPIPLRPIFMASFACGTLKPAGFPHAGQTLPDYSDNVTFPNVTVPRYCPAGTNTYADATDVTGPKLVNCLRVLDFDPLDNTHKTAKLTPNQVNVLAQAYDASATKLPYNTLWLDQNGAPLNSSFDRTLKSWYMPPNYKAIFFRQNPVNVAPESAGPYYVASPGSLVTDAFTQQVMLSDGVTPFIGSANNQAIMNAPYMVVIELESFDSVLIDMCVNNAQTYLGGVQNSLNTVWVPQTNSCDSLLTAICTSNQASDVVKTKIAGRYGTLCGCFDQQQKLDQKFGADRNVSSLCFGHLVTSPTNDFEHACSFDEDAYKTKEMQNQACTIGVCQDLQQNFIVAPGQKPPSCTAGKVVLPGSNSLDNVGLNNNSNSGSNTPKPVEEWTIPIWCHIMAGITGALLMACLISLLYWR